MGWNTAIAWAHDTFNPWWGCVEVSPGCDHCYARTAAHRYGNAVWGKDAPRRFFTDKHWDLPYKWNRAAEKSGDRRRVFCASMADILEERDDTEGYLMEQARKRLWVTIEQTPSLDWLLLTKRSAAYRRLVPQGILDRPNVWPGVTVENEDYVWRVKDLIALDCSGPRWVSYEPALGPVDFSPYMPSVSYSSCQNRDYDVTPSALRALAIAGSKSMRFPALNWVVVGGESGFLPPLGHDQPRPFDLAWARAALAQCRGGGQSFFFKQLGARPVEAGVSIAKKGKGDDPLGWPEDLRVQEFPR